MLGSSPILYRFLLPHDIIQLSAQMPLSQRGLPQSPHPKSAACPHLVTCPSLLDVLLHSLYPTLFPPCECTGVPQGPLSHPLSSALWCRQGTWAQEGRAVTSKGVCIWGRGLGLTKPSLSGYSGWLVMPEHVSVFSSEWRESTPERDLEQKAR